MPYKPAYRAARAIKGITQENAAAVIGVAASTLSKWENGETEPSASQIYKMSVVYGISADKLIGSDKLI